MGGTSLSNTLVKPLLYRFCVLIKLSKSINMCCHVNHIFLDSDGNHSCMFCLFLFVCVCVFILWNRTEAESPIYICVSRKTVLVACSAPSHYLNQCWLIVNWNSGNKFQWQLYQKNVGFFIQKCRWNVGRATAISSPPPCMMILQIQKYDSRGVVITTA